jgi:hypothetical protein
MEARPMCLYYQINYFKEDCLRLANSSAETSRADKSKDENTTLNGIPSHLQRFIHLSLKPHEAFREA